MFAILVELVTGRYVATSYNDRFRCEWPPHPARLFSALVATWGADDLLNEAASRKRAALEWLEQLPPPEVLADPISQAGIRTVVPVFVPVNDVYQVGEVDREKLDAAEMDLAATTDPKERLKAEKLVSKLRAKLAADTARAIAVPAKFGKDPAAGLQVLPEHRGKQPRTFPCATPANPKFAFVWRDATAAREHAADLEQLLGRLVRVGHSSSMVRAQLIGEDGVARLRAELAVYRPDEHAGEHVIRWIERGQVARLCRAHDLHRESEPRILPAQFVRYTTGDPQEHRPVPGSLFGDDFIVFARRAGPRLPITAAVGLATQFRRALMACADQPIDPVISGHQPDGAPLDTTHLAVIPLPVVTGPRADGALVGIALVLPRDCDANARRAVMRAVGRLEQSAGIEPPGDPPHIELALGRAGVVRLQRLAWMEPSWTLDARSWCRPSRRWGTATPIALDRNPGDLHAESFARRNHAFEAAAELLSEAVQRLGLPAPTHIEVSRSCVLPGTAKPRTYPRYPSDPNRTQRVLVHARLEFRELVRGPLLIGAGRYRGLGLCLPTDQRAS